VENNSNTVYTHSHTHNFLKEYVIWCSIRW